MSWISCLAEAQMSGDKFLKELKAKEKGQKKFRKKVTNIFTKKKKRK